MDGLKRQQFYLKMSFHRKKKIYILNQKAGQQMQINLKYQKMAGQKKMQKSKYLKPMAGQQMQNNFNLNLMAGQRMQKK